MAVTTFSKQFLSGSSNGRGIKVAANATPGTLVHTSHATDKDEIWLWVTDNHSVDVDVTVEFGGVTDPDDIVKTQTITVKTGLNCVIPGLILSNAVVVRVFASVANVVSVFGYVNRINVV